MIIYPSIGGRVRMGSHEVEVQRRCSSDHGCWKCTSHDQDCPTTEELIDHLTDVSSRHVMVWVCEHHGAEVADVA